MCGICGFTKAEESDLPILKSMCDVMSHRGPDGEGQYIHDGIALGHRRLSLIDILGGNQPMVRSTGDHSATIGSPAVTEAGRYAFDEPKRHMRGDWCIVFNGEIYNFQDLRRDLEAEGWEFSTNSDTEVLLVSYIAWGEDALQKLRGMFAFAIWDGKRRELFCARDFFGIKPFYYTVQDRQFIFASEIKCILEHPSYRRELNREALDAYLCFQFSALPETFFKGVYKLMPGHLMRVSEDGSVDIARYWRPSYDFDGSRSLEETSDRIHETMTDSVRYHNVADVEVGSFLSSGIDSSYMAACLAEQNPGIKTFTVGFDIYEGERDEISWARELADELDVRNTSKYITEEEYWEALPKVVWHMDEPLADPSAIALYFVDQIASEQVKAVLSGEGADEFFGGYRIYHAPLSNRRLGAIPKPLLKGASKAMRKLGIRGANYLERASEGVEDWYYTNANGVAFTAEERDRVLKSPSTSPSPQQIVSQTYGEVSDQDEVTRMQYVDLYFWLVGDILLKTDKMSMAHSLESRVPFMDRKVFELACTIPVSQKVVEGQTKIALRNASRRSIPQEWAEKEKLGFPVPIVNWLREDAHYQAVRDEFTSPSAAMFFDRDELLKILDEHRAGTDNSRKIWIVYMFLLWYRIFFESQPEPE